ncbi:MAG: hypothetical protein V7K77_23220 [Nostoc sp.]
MLEMLGLFLNPDYQKSAIALPLTWTSQPKENLWLHPYRQIEG